MSDVGQNVGAINVKLGLDSSGFKAALGQAQGSTSDLKKAFIENSTALKKMQLEMLNTAKPTKEMKEQLKLLEIEAKKSKLALDISNNSLSKTSIFAGMAKTALGGIATGLSLAAITVALEEVGRKSIEVSSKFEQLNVSFGVLAGQKAGQQLVKDLTDLANVTPMTTEGLAENSKLLLSFGEAAQNIIPDLKLLGDISGGNQLKMNMLTLAFAQMGATGRLMGQDLLQMVNAGFNPLQQMSEKTGKSMGQLKKEMENGQITFSMVKQAMVDATSEGGRFSGMMEKQSRTLEGRLSTLSDKWALVGKSIGDKFLPMAKAATDGMIKIADATQNAINWLESEKSTLAALRDNWDKYWASKNKSDATLVFTAEPWVKQQKALKDTENASKSAEKAHNGFKDSLSESKGAKKSNPALDAYKSFIEQYKQATNDYEATLKAKKYVEDTLGMSAIQVDKSGYDNAITAYKDYYSKISEINQSEAINKGILLKRNEEKLQADLKLISLNSTQEALIAQNEIIKGFQEQSMKINNGNRAEGELGGVLGSFQSGYAQKLEILKWYYDERDKIINTANLTAQQKQEAFNQLDLLQNQKLAEANKNIWRDRGTEISGIVSNSLDTMLTNYGGFSATMKQLAVNLAREMLKIAIQDAMAHISVKQMEAAAVTALNAVMGFFTGGTSTAISGGMSFMSGIKTAHSGGYQLPGTDEQLKLLKGGERVLSPAETTAYNNNQSGVGGQGTNIVYAPQVKAMDSRDVASWFNENKNQIINIIAQGTKDNTGGLRTVIGAV